MRDIKFRTWDTQNKEFSEWTNRDPHFSTSHGKIFFWERTRNEDGSYGGDIILEDYGDRFVLQQYTGLKDKNGKEIYEGDILKIKLYEKWFSDVAYDAIHQVFYNPDRGAFVHARSPETFLSGMIFDPYTFDPLNPEVIGNIFENPELLKQ